MLSCFDFAREMNFWAIAVRMVLAVGYSAESKEPRKKVRKPLEEVCSFNQW